MNRKHDLLAFKVFFVIFALVGAFNFVYATVALDDTITPQTCSRTDGHCANFVDTSSNGQVKWGAFIAGGLRSLTNLFVDGKVGVGTLKINSGEQPLKLDVNGAVGAKFYCDEKGNNCVAGEALKGGSVDLSLLQKRVTGACPEGNAIRVVNEDGTVTCQSVSGSVTGDSFWRAVGNDIENTNTSGQVQINGNNSAGTALTIKNTSTGGVFLTLTDKNGIAKQGAIYTAPNGVNSDLYLETGNTGNIYLGDRTPSGSTYTKKARMIIQANGNVGINPGTSRIDNKFEVNLNGAASNPSTIFMNMASASDSSPRLGTNYGNGSYLELYNVSTGDMTLKSKFPGAIINLLNSVKIVDGTQGAGKVLTSDVNGLASWKTVAAAANPAAGKSCSNGQMVKGFDNNGNIVCGDIFTTSTLYPNDAATQWSSTKNGFKDLDLGVHKICGLQTVQFSMPAGEWGNPTCKIWFNQASGKWTLQAGSDSKVGAFCKAICRD